MISFEDQYSRAFAVKRTLPAINHFDIHALQKLPTFFNWIDCEIDERSSFKMYLAGADDGVALRFFWNGGYERFTLRAWSEYASRSTNFVIDIGSHTGAYTLAAFKSDAQNVVSFEPSFMNFSRLLMNIRGNGFRPDNAFMFGVGETDKSEYFSIPTNLYYLSAGGMIGERKGCFNFPIRVISLDNFFDRESHKIDLIKMDVEGYEPRVLQGAAHLIKTNKPVIFFECLSDEVGKIIYDLLRPVGYQFWCIDDLEEKLIPVSELHAELDKDGKILMSRLNRIASCSALLC